MFRPSHAGKSDLKDPVPKGKRLHLREGEGAWRPSRRPQFVWPNGPLAVVEKLIDPHRDGRPRASPATRSWDFKLQWRAGCPKDRLLAALDAKGVQRPEEKLHPEHPDKAPRADGE